MATGDGQVVSADTNIALYSRLDDAKAVSAQVALAKCDFLSVQVLNEFMNVSRRKLGRSLLEISAGLRDLRELIPDIRPVQVSDNERAVRLTERYKIQFYDALMIAVALANGADTLYSEDMHNGLVIDGRLTVRNPFREHPVP